MPKKSDLRNHCAIVQPRPGLYDSAMATQITLKTEGPHGLPSGRRTEVDPRYPGLIILVTDYDCGQRFTPKRSEPCANATARERGEQAEPVPRLARGTTKCASLRRVGSTGTTRLTRLSNCFVKSRCPWQESNPWGSVLRVICVTIALSYNRGCTIAQWLRKSLLKDGRGGLFCLFQTRCPLAHSSTLQVGGKAHFACKTII
jgi:hypothetical protein